MRVAYLLMILWCLSIAGGIALGSFITKGRGPR